MKKPALAAVVILMLAFDGCAPSTVQSGEALLESTPAETYTVSTPTPAPAEQASYDRIELVRLEENSGDGNLLIYPAAESQDYSELNALIYDKARSGFDELQSDAYTFFSVKCNTGGILSLLFGYYDMNTGELLMKKPYTVDINTLGEITLEQLFDPSDDRWRALMPDIVSEQAESRGLVLLSDILPIEDGRLFYVTETAVTVIYRPYEIATYSAGWPEFSIRFDKLKTYAAGDGYVERLLELSGNE